MQKWLAAALDYVPRWLDFQMQVAAARLHDRDRPREGRARARVRPRQSGHGEPLTPRHRFRVASHSKSFTAAGIMKLRERRKLKLDDTAGQYVGGLHRQVAQATIAQIALAHRRADPRRRRCRAVPRPAAVLQCTGARRRSAGSRRSSSPASRFKYSNHGYRPDRPDHRGDHRRAVPRLDHARDHRCRRPQRDDIPTCRCRAARRSRAATAAHPARPPRGHSGRQPDQRDRPGRRVRQHRRRHRALLRAALAERATSVLSAASRREMSRRHWRNPMTAPEQHYGLGTISGSLDGWDWFGHSGGLQGYISRTCVYPAQDLTVCVLTNAIDGWAESGSTASPTSCRLLARRAADPQGAGLERALVEPVERARSRAGRQQGAGARARLHRSDDQRPRARNHRPHHGRIAKAPGFGSHGEPVSCVRDRAGKVVEVWLAASKMLPEAKVAKEMQARYGTAAAVAAARRRMRKPSRRQR